MQADMIMCMQATIYKYRGVHFPYKYRGVCASMYQYQYVPVCASTYQVRCSGMNVIIAAHVDNQASDDERTVHGEVMDVARPAKRERPGAPPPVGKSLAPGPSSKTRK
jgi:hypothetical protein